MIDRDGKLSISTQAKALGISRVVDASQACKPRAG